MRFLPTLTQTSTLLFLLAAALATAAPPSVGPGDPPPGTLATVYSDTGCSRKISDFRIKEGCISLPNGVKGVRLWFGAKTFFDAACGQPTGPAYKYGQCINNRGNDYRGLKLDSP